MSEPLRGVPQDSSNESTETQDSTASTAKDSGSKTKESRWEFGFFARKVTTESATPPDWNGGGPET